MRQIFLSWLIGPGGMIEGCRGRLRNLSGASEEVGLVPDGEFVSLTFTPFSLRTSLKGA